MIKILEENYKPSTKFHCKKCGTLFEYQEEDIETEIETYDSWYDTIVSVSEFITCPKCCTKHILSEYIEDF